MHQIEAIFSHIQDKDLSNLASKLTIDKCNTKILGSLMFKGLMRLILSGKKTSLRMLEMVMNQDLNVDVTYSGLSKRLRSLNPNYFKEIYQNLIKSSEAEFNESDQQNLHKFDSTIIALSGRLVQDGLKIGGKENDNHIKVSFGLRNQLPTSIRFCTESAEINENVALIKAINEAKVKTDDILLFDRGINSGHSFNDLCTKEYKFITRVTVGRKYKIIKMNTMARTIIEDNVFVEDIIIQFYGAEPGGKRDIKKTIENNLRLIKIINHQSYEIWFLTNLFDASAQEIADMYKRRWDIETFFKFLKQNLGYKHFLSHSLNGMKVYIYMILITAVLFLLYKKRNNLSGFKLALFEFSLKVDKSFVKDLIILSGGDPNANAIKHYFK